MAHKIPVSVASLDSPQFEGWASKQGGSGNSGKWQRRWFVIKGDKIWYFKGEHDKFAKGYIDLPPGTEIKQVTKPGQKRKFAFDISSRGVKGDRVFHLFVESETDMKAFLKACKAVIDGAKIGDQSKDSGSSMAQPIPQPPPQSAYQAPPVEQPIQPPPPPPPVEQPQTYYQPPPPPVEQPPQQSAYQAPPAAEPLLLNIPSITPGTGVNVIKRARDMTWVKKNDPEGVYDFLDTWITSLPSGGLSVGEIVKFSVDITSNFDKLTWRANSPQQAIIQNMVDFYWNAQAPEEQIEKLNDIGSQINPQYVGSWISESIYGGMDGGWNFPVECDLETAMCASDDSDKSAALNPLMEWAQRNSITNVVSLGRDMGAEPPRQTTYYFRIGGANQVKLAIIKDAFQTFGFPAMDNGMDDIILNEVPYDLTLVVVLCVDGFVSISVVVPKPSAKVLCGMLTMKEETKFDEHQKFLNAFGQPDAVEYYYLNPGYGYELYKEQVDIHVHYNLGGITA